MSSLEPTYVLPQFLKLFELNFQSYGMSTSKVKGLIKKEWGLVNWDGQSVLTLW